MKFYIDGTLRGTTNATGTIPNGGRDIWVGSNDNWSEHFAGVIDELYIYDRALSEGEIQALMNPAPPVQHSLAASVVGSGSVGLSPSGGVYAAGTPVELTAVADAGWQFSGWSGDLTGADNPATITMDGDKSVTAIFTEVPAEQHTLTVGAVGNGSVGLSPSGGLYAAGTPVELTAVADAGWQFSGWSGDLTGADNPATITMDGDKSVTAIFTEVSAEQHTLTVGAVGSGSVGLSPSGGVYAAGTPVELTAVADAGWQFSGWSGDLTGADNPATITMDGDKSVTAIFTEVSAEQHTLTVGAVGSGSVGLSPSGGVYAAGTPVELTAVADAGWQFSGWSGDLTGADNPATITMDGDKSVTAIFTEWRPSSTR